MFQVDRLDGLRARREPEPPVEEESVGRRAPRLTLRGDGRDDQMAHAHELTSQIGARESTIG